MTLAGLSKIERVLDRVAPAIILGLGLTVTFAAMSLYALLASPALAEPPDYLRDVKPLLMARCGECHGEAKQQEQAFIVLALVNEELAARKAAEPPKGKTKAPTAKAAEREAPGRFPAS